MRHIITGTVLKSAKYNSKAAYIITNHLAFIGTKKIQVDVRIRK